MKIWREVNGVNMEFELTATELINAYQEKEHEYDVDWMIQLLEDDGYDLDSITEEQLNEIANLYRESFCAYGDDLGEVEHDHFDWVIRDLEYRLPRLED